MTPARSRTALVPLLALMLALSLSLGAEESGGTTTPASGQPAAPSAAGASPSALPQGFSAPQENFFRRFEIIALGSLPITLLYTNIGFQLYHFVDNDFDMSWAPWPFEGENTDSITDSERFTRIGIAAGVAVAVAGVDALVRYLQARKAERLAAAKSAFQAGEGTVPPSAEPAASP
jgi:hypothetical protein